MFFGGLLRWFWVSEWSWHVVLDAFGNFQQISENEAKCANLPDDCCPSSNGVLMDCCRTLRVSETVLEDEETPARHGKNTLDSAKTYKNTRDDTDSKVPYGKQKMRELFPQFLIKCLFFVLILTRTSL